MVIKMLALAYTNGVEPALEIIHVLTHFNWEEVRQSITQRNQIKVCFSARVFRRLTGQVLIFISTSHNHNSSF